MSRSALDLHPIAGTEASFKFIDSPSESSPRVAICCGECGARLFDVKQGFGDSLFAEWLCDRKHPRTMIRGCIHVPSGMLWDTASTVMMAGPVKCTHPGCNATLAQVAKDDQRVVLLCRRRNRCETARRKSRISVTAYEILRAVQLQREASVLAAQFAEQLALR